MKKRFKSLSLTIKNIVYLLVLAWNYEKGFIAVLPFTIFVKTVSPFIVIILPKYIIDEITMRKRINVAVALVLGMAVVLILSRLLTNILDNYNKKKILLVKTKLNLELHKKIMLLDFPYLEDPAILDMYQKAVGIITEWQADLQRLVGAITGIISGILKIVGLIYILLALNPIIFVIILIIIFFNSSLSALAVERQYKMYQQFAPHVRKVNYLVSELQDNAYAKDIRTYSMSNWLTEKSKALLIDIFERVKKVINFQAMTQCIATTLNVLQESGMYIYIGWLAFKRIITLGSFTMYIAAINNFTNSLKDIADNFIILQQAGLYISELKKFLSLENGRQDKELKDVPVCLKEHNIEFVNVWFKYPRQNEFTLKNLSITIKSGKKLSIVGDNGAGKTTFVKLLMRLYKPTKGKILLNGRDISTYSYQQYMNIIGVVFQDYKILAFTVKENLAFAKSEDEERINEVLKIGGLYDRVQRLPRKLDNFLYKQFEADGVELSGGEQQKLAICRAIYKDSPIVILDEPTANLSPIAEHEVLEKFNMIVKNKTAIYISHRMSSCRFSDNIAVFENGEIVEYGDHNNLMAHKGKYADMFNKQAKYYIKA